MLRKIFKHFQLERDRIGMLGERNLLIPQGRWQHGS